MKKASLFPPFAALLRQALGDLLDPQATTILEMMDDNIVFEFPYAPEGGIKKIIGKEDLARYLEEISDLIEIDSMTLSRSLFTAERDTAVLEFSGTGILKEHSQPYIQHYISVIEIKNQQIIHYRDYWDPLALTVSTPSKDPIQGASHEA